MPDTTIMLQTFLADIRRGDADALAIATDYLTDCGCELPEVARLLLPTALLGYAGRLPEYTDGLLKKRLWPWLELVQGQIWSVRSEKFRWQAVRDMEIDWNSEIDWHRMTADSHGAEIRLRNLKRRVLALFPDVKWIWGLNLSLDAVKDLLDKGTTLADFRHYVHAVKTIMPGWENNRGLLTRQLLSKGFWSHLPVQRQESMQGFWFTQWQSAPDLIPPEPQQKDGQQ